jgi:hypothetical protein
MVDLLDRIDGTRTLSRRGGGGKDGPGTDAFPFRGRQLPNTQLRPVVSRAAVDSSPVDLVHGLADAVHGAIGRAILRSGDVR